MPIDDSYLSNDLNSVAAAIANWRSRKGFDTHWGNCPEKLMLVVTELSEAMEAYRHLTEQTLDLLQSGAVSEEMGLYTGNLDSGQRAIVENFAEEMADTFIRLLDMVGSLGIDISDSIARKMAKNEKRPYRHGKEC